MIDSIGLGEFVANAISLFILMSALVGGFLMFYFKRKYIAIVWISILLNILSSFYFLGVSLYMMPVINFFIWPIVNIVLIIILTVKYLKSKKKNEAN